MLRRREVVKAEIKAAKKNRDEIQYPQRPINMGITDYVLWKEIHNARVAVADADTERITNCESELKKLDQIATVWMPKAEKLYIPDHENGCIYSVWWTTRWDENGFDRDDVRIECLDHSSPITPMSKQIDGDDLESDLEKALWDIETDEDGLEVEYEDEDTVEEYGDDDIPTISIPIGVPFAITDADDDEPPAPATVDDIPF